VPVQIANLLLKEIKLRKHTYVGVASPTQNSEIDYPDEHEICVVQRELSDTDQSLWEYDKYSQGKLRHLTKAERRILEPVLRKYCYLFYGFGSTDIGCTSQVQHVIETRDARPIKRNPYRIPHVLKPVISEHIDEMLEKGIIEPSASPWSSSVV
jgi:hypothetical protein